MSNEMTYWISRNEESLERVADDVWTGISLKLGKYYLAPEILDAEEPVVADPSLVRYEADGIAYAIFTNGGDGIIARFGAERQKYLDTMHEAMRGAGYSMLTFPTPSMENEARDLDDMTGYSEQHDMTRNSEQDSLF